MLKFQYFLHEFENWKSRGAPFWAPFFINDWNAKKHTLNFFWNKKSYQYDKYIILYLFLKCLNKHFQKTARQLIFGAPKWSSESRKIKFERSPISNKPKKCSKIAITLNFFPVKADIPYFSNMKKRSPKRSPLSGYFVLTEKVQNSFSVNFWRYFWLLDLGGSVLGSVFVCRNVQISYLPEIEMD